MRCRKCGAQLADGARICYVCRTPVAAPGKGPGEGGTAGSGQGLNGGPSVPPNWYEDSGEDPYSQYPDDFEGGEGKGHALVTTILVLLLIAALTGAATVAYLVYLGKMELPENIRRFLAIETVETEEEPFVIEYFTEAMPEEETEAETERETAEQTEAGTALSGISAEMARIMDEKSTAARYGIYVYDIGHMQEYRAGNCEEGMYASAAVTVPILYTAAVKLDAGQITLNDNITYVNSAGGRGEAYPEQRDGRPYPLSYYLSTMLTYSDNNCINCLIDYLGMDQINTACRNAGYESVDLQRKIALEGEEGTENYISARDLAVMLRELYGGKFLTIGTEFIRNYFHIYEGDYCRTILGLAENLPEDALFLNQNGRSDTRYSEVALVSTGSCTYVVGAMCSGDYGFEYETALREVSAYIYSSLA